MQILGKKQYLGFSRFFQILERGVQEIILGKIRFCGIKTFSKSEKNLANPRLKKNTWDFQGFLRGINYNGDSGGTRGSGKGKSSMRVNSFGGGS